jgi:hypothetical protein
MANRSIAFQTAQNIGFREAIADQADMAFGEELPPIKGNNAGRFLPAMLKGMQAESGQGRRVGMPEHAEDAALIMKVIVMRSVGDHGSGPFSEGVAIGAAGRNVGRLAPKHLYLP